MKNPLSNEFKVACEIYKAEERGESVWFSKLVRGLDGKLTASAISRSIETLFDWGIIRAEYGPTEKHGSGRLFTISVEARPRIKDLYENYWRD